MNSRPPCRKMKRVTKGVCKATHFEITTDVAYGPKPRAADFRGTSKCYCQSIVRHETREPWNPANSIEEESQIRSYLVSRFESISMYERVDVLYTFVAKSDW